MKKLIITLSALLGFFLISCSPSEDKRNITDEETTLSKITTDTIVQRKEEVIEIPFSMELVGGMLVDTNQLQFPFVVKLDQLETLAEDEFDIEDLFERKNTDPNSSELSFLIGFLKEKSSTSNTSNIVDELKKAIDFYDLNRDSYDQFLDTCSEWETKYGIVYRHGMLKVDDTMSVLIYRAKSAYGDMGTSGTRELFFGALISEDRLYNLFEIGYLYIGSDSPVSVKMSTEGSLSRDLVLSLKKTMITEEYDYDKDTTIISQDPPRKEKYQIHFDKMNALKELE